MNFRVATFGLALCSITCCSAKQHRTVVILPVDVSVQPDSESETNGSDTRRSRLKRYAEAFRRDETVTLIGESGSIETKRNCDAIHWRIARIEGTSGNAFHETQELLLVSRDAADISRAGGSVPKMNSRPGIGEITMAVLISGLPGYGVMHKISDVPNPETSAVCTIIEVDSCAGRIGYVCEGFVFDQEFEGGGTDDGSYAFELDIADITTYRLVGDETTES